VTRGYFQELELDLFVRSLGEYCPSFPLGSQYHFLALSNAIKGTDVLNR